MSSYTDRVFISCVLKSGMFQLMFQVIIIEGYLSEPCYAWTKCTFNWRLLANVIIDSVKIMLSFHMKSCVIVIVCTYVNTYDPFPKDAPEKEEDLKC